MGRTLTFEQITDSRFDSNPATLLKERKREITTRLKAMSGVHVSHDNTYKVEFDDNFFASNYQFRCRFYVKKIGRKVTWNDIYKVVNSVHSVQYRFI